MTDSTPQPVAETLERQILKRLADSAEGYGRMYPEDASISKEFWDALSEARKYLNQPTPEEPIQPAAGQDEWWKDPLNIELNRIIYEWDYTGDRHVVMELREAIDKHTSEQRAGAVAEAVLEADGHPLQLALRYGEEGWGEYRWRVQHAIELARDGCAHDFRSARTPRNVVTEQCSKCRQPRWRVPQ